MASLPVSLELRDATAVLTLRDPDRRNVLSREMVQAIGDAVQEAEDSAARSLLVAACGPAFCAGAELDTLLSAADGEFAPVTAVYEAFLRVRRSSLVTVAVVEGPAVGAGFNLALACDLRVAGPRARFESRFAKLRLHPGGGHLFMLQQIVGPQDALRLALLGEAWDAPTALARGLVTTVDDDPVSAATAIVASLADLPKSYVQRVLATARRSPELPGFDDALALETVAQHWSTTQPEFVEGIATIRAAIARG
ncbi:enoyl-CoA hydratase-related protein [Microbacterium sp. RD1]|uniref:enoyl-CoA hydratase-related protein n=1 Tax=Microbacterium sp. RD1 TaxID=3457313 RepID=UPI003FA5C0BF